MFTFVYWHTLVDCCCNAYIRTFVSLCINSQRRPWDDWTYVSVTQKGKSNKTLLDILLLHSLFLGPWKKAAEIYVRVTYIIHYKDSCRLNFRPACKNVNSDLSRFKDSTENIVLKSIIVIKKHSLGAIIFLFSFCMQRVNRTPRTRCKRF